MTSTRKKIAAAAAATALLTGGFLAGQAQAPDVDLPPAQVEPAPTTEHEPGDIVHIDDTEHVDPDPARSDSETAEVSAEDHGDHHWFDRQLVFVDYTGGKFAASIAKGAKLWNDVGARIQATAVDGGSVRYNCGTSGTTGDTIPVCLAPADVSYLGNASWGFDASGHTVRGAVNVRENLSAAQADRTTAHEVGHIIRFRHGGGCIMEQTSVAPNCTTPSDQDRAELRAGYDHGGEGEPAAQPAPTTTTTAPPPPTTTTTVKPTPTTAPPAPTALSECRRLHKVLHETARAASSRGVSSSSINELNRQLHNRGCR